MVLHRGACAWVPFYCTFNALGPHHWVNRQDAIQQISIQIIEGNMLQSFKIYRKSFSLFLPALQYTTFNGEWA